jgi:hypothetical protein
VYSVGFTDAFVTKPGTANNAPMIALLRVIMKGSAVATELTRLHA